MIFHDYVRGDLTLNKRSYRSSIITIFLAVLVLSTFVFGVSSYYKSYRDLIGNSTGGYHFRIVSEISKKDALALKGNRHIKKLGLFTSQVLDQGFGSKSQTMFFKMDENSLGTLESWLKEGELPKVNEIMVSNDMARELGKKRGDDLLLNEENYRIAGIYYDITYEFDDFYNVYLNVDQEKLLEEEEDFSPFIWYKNIFKSYSLSEKIMTDLETDDLTYNYNHIYLDRSFVFDPDDNLLKDHSFQIIIIGLFLILVLLFYFIITSLFSVQEAKSIQDYSRLKAIGGTSRDINRIVRLKAIYLSQLPIIAGILSSMVLVQVLFLAINQVERYFAKTKGILESKLDLNLYANFKFMVIIYLLTSLLIYLATKKPSRKLRKNSILRGLKGDLDFKAYKKYDLEARGHIERDLAQQFYKNSRRNFRSSGLSLKLGFILMAFIMMVIAYVDLDENLNTLDKYTSYNIQARYASMAPLSPDLLGDLDKLDPEDLINFRSETVYLDYDPDLIDKNYRENGYLDKLEEELRSLEAIRLNIIGLDDQAFNRLIAERGLDPASFQGNKVLLLNTIGNRFDLPLTRISDQKFLKEDLTTISLSEYGQVLKTRGYEFSLDIEEKISSPLFDYPLSKNRLNCYMPKSEYIKLFDSFERIADLDQFEYLALRSSQPEEDIDQVRSISLNYFKEGDFDLESKIDQDNLSRKRNLIGNILAVFLSVFFVIIGFSNSYFAFYNLFLKRRDELLLYKALGMDKDLLDKILRREKNKILFSFIASMPLLLILMAFLVASSSKVFTSLDILGHLNYFFILGYIFVIYLSLSTIYNRSRRDII